MCSKEIEDYTHGYQFGILHILYKYMALIPHGPLTLVFERSMVFGFIFDICERRWWNCTEERWQDKNIQ